jgi:lipopolysaccharide/colanic/teichoic acid biosynthesis glycosyltransferase
MVTSPTDISRTRGVKAPEHVLVSTSEPKWSYRLIFKRWFDICFSILILPLALPFGLLAALLIRIDSAGPVLIKVKRLGKDGSTFFKYKFRTMVPNAEEILRKLLESNPEIRQEYERTYKIKQDPRITRFGRWLRLTSLDELPQILNVFRGEMSWVGPRDILGTELVKYGQFARKLLTVQPGITGLWQVSGRSKLTYMERIQLDMRYIDRLSFLLDLKILCRTVPVVVTGYGAV